MALPGEANRFGIVATQPCSAYQALLGAYRRNYDRFSTYLPSHSIKTHCIDVDGLVLCCFASLFFTYFFFSLFWNKVAIVVWPLEIDSSTGNWYPRQSHIGNVEDSIKMVRCSKILNVYIRVHILLDVTGRQQRYLTSQVWPLKCEHHNRQNTQVGFATPPPSALFSLKKKLSSTRCGYRPTWPTPSSPQDQFLRMEWRCSSRWTTKQATSSRRRAPHTSRKWRTILRPSTPLTTLRLTTFASKWQESACRR